MLKNQKYETKAWQEGRYNVGGKGLDPHLLDPKEIPDFDWKTPELERLHEINKKAHNFTWK